MGNDESGGGCWQDIEENSDYLSDRVSYYLLVPMGSPGSGRALGVQSHFAYAGSGCIAADRALLRDCGAAPLLLFDPDGGGYQYFIVGGVLGGPVTFPGGRRRSVRNADERAVPAGYGDPGRRAYVSWRGEWRGW